MAPQSPPLPPPPTGTIVVIDLGPDCRLSVDGVTRFLGPRLGGLGSWNSVVFPGNHSIRITRFGFAELAMDVEISPYETIRINPAWQPIPFGLRGIMVSPETFDPADPGSMGSTILTLEAAAPGKAHIFIFDEAGRIVREFPELDIHFPLVTLRWNGRDDRGRILEAGRYRISIAGAGEPPIDAGVRIGNQLYSRSAVLFSGSGGTLFAPDARAIGPGRIETMAGILGHIVSAEGPVSGRATIHGGIRLGIPSVPEPVASTAPSSWELDVSTMAILHPGSAATISSDSMIVTAALKMPMGGSPILSALLAKVSYGTFIDPQAGDWPSPWDGPARFPGISLGIPLEYDQDNLRLFITPEVDAGAFYPGYDPARVPGFYGWAYLRGGLELTLGGVSTAISGILRTKTFDQGLSLSLPVSVGLESRWHAPNSRLVLSLIATGEFDSRSEYYASAGLAIGLHL